MLNQLLPRHAALSYTLLRVVAGTMFAFHGAQKMLGVLTDKPGPELLTQMWFGGVIELVCGAAIALGLFTRWAAFLASGTMAVAYCQFHWQLQLDDKFFPIVNKGELALLYSFLFLYMACHGSGCCAVDAHLCCGKTCGADKPAA